MHALKVPEIKAGGEVRSCCPPHACIGICDGNGCGESGTHGCRLLRITDAGSMLFGGGRHEAANRMTTLCRRSRGSRPPTLRCQLPRDGRGRPGHLRLLEVRTLAEWVKRWVGRRTGRPLVISLPGLCRKPEPPPMPSQLALLRAMSGALVQDR